MYWYHTLLPFFPGFWTRHGLGVKRQEKLPSNMFSTFGAQRNTARTKGRTLALKRCKMALKRRKIVQKAGDNRNMLFCKVLPNWQRIVHSTFLWFYTGCDRYNSSCKPHKWWFLANKKLPVWGRFIHVYRTHFCFVMTDGKHGGESHIYHQGGMH